MCVPDVRAGHLEGIVLDPSVGGGGVGPSIHLHTVYTECFIQFSRQGMEVQYMEVQCRVVM